MAELASQVAQLRKQLLRFMGAEHDNLRAAVGFRETTAHLVQIARQPYAPTTSQPDQFRTEFGQLLAEQRTVHAAVAECVEQLRELTTEPKATTQLAANERPSQTQETTPPADVPEEHEAATSGSRNEHLDGVEPKAESKVKREDRDITDRLIRFRERKRRENRLFRRAK